MKILKKTKKDSKKKVTTAPLKKSYKDALVGTK